jgi:hypothetical protein
MDNQIICFDCTHVSECISFDTNKGIIQKNYYCSENKLIDFLNSVKCDFFEHKEHKQDKKEEVCYLFTEEEWEAMCNGTYVKR